MLQSVCGCLDNANNAANIKILKRKTMFSRIIIFGSHNYLTFDKFKHWFNYPVERFDNCWSPNQWSILCCKMNLTIG